MQTPYLSGRLVDPFAQVMDVQSFSHQFENVPEYHNIAPWKAVGYGETGSCQCDRGYFGATNKSVGAFGFGGVLDCVVENLQALAIPYSFGGYSWTLTDYLGETSLGWPDVSSHFGAFDLAGFPKDTVALYKTWWAPGACDSVVISPSDWSAPTAVGSPIDVAAFSCAASVALYLNGEARGTQAVSPLGYVSWAGVPFQPGNLTAGALNAAGAVVGSTTVLSAGPPAALRAWVESPYLPPRDGTIIAADGADAALIGVQVIDAAGNPCPLGMVNVSIAIQGPAELYGVANGNPADHSPVKFTPWRLTSYGKMRAIIASSGSGNTGPIKVTFSAEGLASGSVALTAQ